MDGKLKREQKEQKVEDSGYVRVNAREYAEFLKYKTAKRGEELRSEDQINMYFEILRSYFEDTFITDHLPGMDRYFSIQSFSNVAAMGINLLGIPMEDMLALIHGWIGEMKSVNPELLWELPQVMDPEEVDGEEEAVPVVTNLMDIRTSLFLEMEQFLEKELLNEERDGK
uniref:hypothetical protein n=2 Tax=Allisonella TaxID=209879 RepID=UPI00307F8DA9